MLVVSAEELSDKIGERLTTHLREMAKANPLLEGIIDRLDFNATTHGQRDLADDRLSNLRKYPRSGSASGCRAGHESEPGLEPANAESEGAA